ncbi:MAG: winged helix-turn-helix transcriptional regulator [Muribaculaceae bacterium]|nr:winged helix-turn-helix transcriptional regulator [Muribaculaceae bacterium]
MNETMEHHLSKSIKAFEESTGETTFAYTAMSTTDKILKLIAENPKHSAQSLADIVGISAKGIEKQLSKLKSQGRIRRIGPNKGGGHGKYCRKRPICLFVGEIFDNSGDFE